MQSDPLFYPYPSRRSVVFADRGMVATSQPLAAQAGLEILKKGGNAIDAAIALAPQNRRYRQVRRELDRLMQSAAPGAGRR